MKKRLILAFVLSLLLLCACGSRETQPAGSAAAPLTVANFVKLAQSGFYT